MAEIKVIPKHLIYYDQKSEFVVMSCRVLSGGRSDNQYEKITGNTSCLKIGHEFILHGSWRNKPARGGWQFEFKSAAECEPISQHGITRKLSSLPSIGPSRAKQIYELLGLECLNAIRADPECISDIITKEETREEIRKKLEKDKENEIVMLELATLFEDVRIPSSAINEIIKKWGAACVSVIKRNPYLISFISGVGFPTADHLWLQLNKPPRAMKRQYYFLLNLMETDRNGDTWHFHGSIRAAMTKMFGHSANTEKAVNILRRGRYLNSRDGGRYYALSWKAMQEEVLATRCASIYVEDVRWPSIEHFLGLTPHQQENVMKISGSSLCVLTGTAGTGKSYVTASIAKAMLSKFPAWEVGIFAPTGKAALRVNELLEEHEVDGIRAQTCHRGLGARPDGDGGFSFFHCQAEPLPYKVLFIDEASMMGVPILTQVLLAVEAGTIVILVGDHHQLPPIDHGFPLLDLLKAGVPVAELTEIHRNAGTAVRSCAMIRDGVKELEFDSKVSLDADPPRNLKLFNCFTSDMEKKVPDIYRKIIENDTVGMTPEDVAVIVPTNALRHELNESIRDIANPHGQEIPLTKFRLNDLVMNLKNRVVKDENDDDLSFDIANGDTGKITRVFESAFVVAYRCPHREVIYRTKNSKSGEKSDMSELTLSYAVTCHKMQGSSARCCIVVTDNGSQYSICDRGWLMTSLSRMEEVCFVFSTKEYLRKIIAKGNRGEKRRTILTELFQEKNEALMGEA